MTHRIVSYTPSGVYVFRNIRKTTDNQPKLLVERGEVATVTLDMTKYLETGETITDATAELNGASVALSLTSPKILATAQSNTGYAKITATLSSGEKVITRLYVQEKHNECRTDYARM